MVQRKYLLDSLALDLLIEKYLFNEYFPLGFICRMILLTFLTDHFLFTEIVRSNNRNNVNFLYFIVSLHFRQPSFLYLLFWHGSANLMQYMQLK